MKEFDRTNRGQIWGNDKKESATHPDFKGDINIEGVEYWISAWKRKPDANPKAPSLTFSVKRKDSKPYVDKAKDTLSKQPVDDFDDDIPF